MFSDKPVYETQLLARQETGPWVGQQGEEAISMKILLDFNDLLGVKANMFSLNERVIENLLEDLDKISPIKNYGF